jgi:hypothetical protein
VQKPRFLNREWYINCLHFVGIHQSSKNKRYGLYTNLVRAGEITDLHIEQLFSLVEKYQKPIASCVRVGNHFTFLYVIDKDTALYVDSKAGNCKAFENTIKKLGKTGYVNNKYFQWDGNSCGPIVAELAMYFQGKYYKNPEALKDLLNVKCKSKNKNIKIIDISQILEAKTYQKCSQINTAQLRSEHQSIYEYQDMDTVQHAAQCFYRYKKYIDITEEKRQQEITKLKNDITNKLQNLLKDRKGQTLKSNCNTSLKVNELQEILNKFSTASDNFASNAEELNFKLQDYQFQYHDVGALCGIYRNLLDFVDDRARNMIRTQYQNADESMQQLIKDIDEKIAQNPADQINTDITSADHKAKSNRAKPSKIELSKNDYFICGSVVCFGYAFVSFMCALGAKEKSGLKLISIGLCAAFAFTAGALLSVGILESACSTKLDSALYELSNRECDKLEKF